MCDIVPVGAEFVSSSEGAALLRLKDGRSDGGAKLSEVTRGSLMNVVYSVFFTRKLIEK